LKIEYFDCHIIRIWMTRKIRKNPSNHLFMVDGFIYSILLSI